MKTYVSVSENHSFQDDNLSKFSKVLLRSLAELFGVFIQVKNLSYLFQNSRLFLHGHFAEFTLA